MELGETLRELQALADTTECVDMLILASVCLDMESENESYQWLGSEDLDIPPLEDINDDGPAFHNGRMCWSFDYEDSPIILSTIEVLITHTDCDQ